MSVSRTSESGSCSHTTSYSVVQAHYLSLFLKMPTTPQDAQRGLVFRVVLLLHNMFEDSTTGQKNGIVQVAQATIQTDWRQRLPITAYRICPQIQLTLLRTSQSTVRIAVSLPWV